MRKLDCWQNLFWEFRRCDTDEAKQVFAEYFNPSTETGPFAEMIEAVAVEIRKGLADWMNMTAFDAVCNSFIKEMDRKLERILSVECETLTSIDQDASAVHRMAKVQGST